MDTLQVQLWERDAVTDVDGENDIDSESDADAEADNDVLALALISGTY